MQAIEFTKMQGLGNDFVVIDGTRQTMKLTSSQIRQLADRHYGIGFDQLLLLEEEPTGEADLVYRIFNADGSEVSQCGNGARCIAKFAIDNHLVPTHFIKVKTKNGLLTLQVETNGLVTVNMGVPQFEPHAIPFLAPFNSAYWIESVPKSISQHEKITFQALSVGNPHAIIWCESSPDDDGERIATYLNEQPMFPEGVNVSFAQLIDPCHISLTVYERGSGLTLACGSAACAAAVAGIRLNKLQENVLVTQAGGDLSIRWSGAEQAVYMSGPAEYVFTGKIWL